MLELQHNQLVGPIPASFGGLQGLSLLDLSHNLLERRIPESVEAMSALQVLTYVSPMSPLYLPHISAISPVYLPTYLP